MREENLHRILPPLREKYASCVSPNLVKIDTVTQFKIIKSLFALATSPTWVLITRFEDRFIKRIRVAPPDTLQKFKHFRQGI
ncbi:hypothetical protein [Calothrix sp. CCY 0018]|uniref:hypothetical protein n=1 Tax=Calothrix sp. CCY 0018 TaxID=3103864 RepID=UPI0039C68ECE